MKQEQPTTSALYRFCCGVASFILFFIGVPTFVKACDRSIHDEPYAWLLFIVAIAALVLAYRVYRPVRVEARRKKEAEDAGWSKLYHDHPELAEAHAREARMQNLAKAIAEELKRP